MGKGKSHRNVKPHGNERKEQGLGGLSPARDRILGQHSVGGRGLGSEKPALGWGREGVSQGGAAGNSWVGGVPGWEMGPDLSPAPRVGACGGGRLASPSSPPTLPAGRLERCH